MALVLLEGRHLRHHLEVETEPSLDRCPDLALPASGKET